MFNMTVAATSNTPAHILIVDDNNMGLVARRTVLEEIGYRVETCASPQEALEQCTKIRFDVVITDFKMPRMNGVEFIQELRKQHPGIPVILISGFVDTLGFNESTTGANAVIQKSANEVSQLIRAVARLLRAPKKPADSQTSGSKAKSRATSAS
jgi:two-component system, NtrC family, sensor kinase